MEFIVHHKQFVACKQVILVCCLISLIPLDWCAETFYTYWEITFTWHRLVNLDCIWQFVWPLSFKIVQPSFSWSYAPCSMMGYWHDTVVLSVHLSVLAVYFVKQYTLQEKCVNKWIGSTPRGTRFYNFQSPIPTPSPLLLIPHPQYSVFLFTIYCRYDKEMLFLLTSQCTHIILWHSTM